MQTVILFLCLFTFTHCGDQTKVWPQDTKSDTVRLIEKMREYDDLAAEYVKRNEGWPNLGCDSLLFAGLYAATGGRPDLTSARDNTGKWFRRPISAGNCYPDESKSEISRDLYLGLLWGAWRTKNLSIVEGIAEFGENRNWNMGEGDPSRTFLTPQIISTLYKIIYSLGGKRQKSKEGFDVVNAKIKGFQAHLLVIHCLLRGELDGSATSECFDVFKYQAERQPKNALFQIAYHYYYDGNQDDAIAILMDETYFPANRLPSGKDRCEPYLWQRDFDDEDWEPCSGVGEHNGIDFLFAADLLTRRD